MKRKFVAKARPAKAILVAWFRYEEQASLHVCACCGDDEADFAVIGYENRQSSEPLEACFSRTLREQEEHGPTEHSRDYYCTFCVILRVLPTFANQSAASMFVEATALFGRGVSPVFYRVASRPGGAVMGLAGPEDTLPQVYEARHVAARHAPLRAKIGVN